MNLFDFVYCDTGENIRGQNGYIYITKKLQDYCDLPNPIKFTDSDQAGMFNCRLNGIMGGETFKLDIYALYCAQLYLEDVSLVISRYSYTTFKYLQSLKTKTFLTDTKQFRNFEYLINEQGMMYFRDHLEPSTDDDSGYIFTCIPPIRNRQARSCGKCYKNFTGELPLVISKGYIPTKYGIEPTEIAKNWGFVTGLAPKQNGKQTHNCFTFYNYNPPTNVLDWLK